MSLKEEIQALKEKEASLAAELGDLKKTFLESEISRDMYDQIAVLQEKLKITGEAIEEKQQALYQDLQAKISKDYAGLSLLREEYETLTAKYSMDAGVQIQEAIKRLMSTGLLFQVDLACKIEQIAKDVSRAHSTASEAFTTGLLTRQDLGLADLEAMNQEIERIEALKPGSDEARAYIEDALNALEEVTDVA